jgi:hypothetical protein
VRLEDRYDRLVNRLTPDFLRSLGLSWAEDQDDQNRQICSGCKFVTENLHVCLDTGEWWDPSGGGTGDLGELMLRQSGNDISEWAEAKRLAACCELMEQWLAAQPEAGELARQRADEFYVRAKALTSAEAMGFEEETGIHHATLIGVGAKKSTRAGILVPVRDGEHVRQLIYVPNTASEEPAVLSEALGAPLDNSPCLLRLGEGGRTWILGDVRDGLVALQEFGGRENVLAFTGAWRDEWAATVGRDVVLVLCGNYGERQQLSSAALPALMRRRERGHIRTLKVVSVAEGIDQPNARLFQWVRAGNTAAALSELAEKADEYEPESKAKPTQVQTLVGMDEPALTNRPVELPLAVIGQDGSTYDVPETFSLHYCKRVSTSPATCIWCVNRAFSVAADSADALGFIGASQNEREQLLRRLGCGKGERQCAFKVLTWQALRPIVVTQYHKTQAPGAKDALVLDGRVEQPMVRPVFYRVAPGSPEMLDPRGYQARGRVRTNPKDGSRTLSLTQLTPILEEYETFDVASARTSLDRIRALGADGMLDDLCLHWTRLRGQRARALLAVHLLTWASPRWLRFQGERIRGWVLSAIVGDTGVGKSKTFSVLQGMVGTGDIFSCQTGGRTGLTYAVVSGKGGWRCQAGLFPRNDGRVLCMEEGQDLAKGEMQELADAMDRGLLEPNRVARARYRCETRLIVNANPAFGRTLADYPLGVKAYCHLFLPAFIRRLDQAMVIRREEKQDTYNQKVAAGKSGLAPEDLRNLVFWAWWLKDSRVDIGPQATDAILAAACTLSERFGQADDVPLLLSTVARMTLARLSAAFAVLAASTPDGGQTLVVTKAHVDAAHSHLVGLYTAPECALDRHSAACKASGSLMDWPVLERALTQRLGGGSVEALAGKNAFARVIHYLAQGQVMCDEDWARQCRMEPSEWTGQAKWLCEKALAIRDSRQMLGMTPRLAKALTALERAHPVVYAAILTAGKQADEKSGAGGDHA